MRFHWLILSLLSTVLFCLPAEAGRLLFWRFESNQNRLLFTTDDGVQPKAQLVFNPTRVVIDLPGIVLGHPNTNQPIGGTIRSVRVGQFDSQTTRLVIELTPGYTVNPQDIKIRGLSSTQWTVDLPMPEPISQAQGMPIASQTTTQSQPASSSFPVTATNQTDSADFQITRNGIYIRVNGGGDNQKIKVQRSRDRQAIEFQLEGVSLPASLVSQTIVVNNYGVSDIQFIQDSTSSPLAHITLAVSKDSPDWQAFYSRLGGLILLPRGGFNAVERNSSSQPPLSPPSPRMPVARQQAVIESVELTNNNTQLLIRANQAIRGTGSWNR
ncbi:MAG: AMIN domain-containing protein, partial [Microcystaceae cyanobacterium]